MFREDVGPRGREIAWRPTDGGGWSVTDFVVVS